ncbi:uncharacterized protein YukE [Hamadaea flava]|uniref:WXG100 family type VII secretion target n=1 Tax=Hamadaea flava TaxID=1742688 RepID=A0ABV8LXH6_9ACTN|nr:type VII secretion target [Hamadaea flava]MCP2329384.1 uncharacterized protein YukE [Hamadaea flava]
MIVNGDRSAAEVRVSPEVLRSAAASTTELAGQAKSALRDVSDDMAYAAGALRDWSTGRALTELMDLWDREETAFGGQLTGLADGLQKSADNYAHADAASAADFGTLR